MGGQTFSLNFDYDPSGGLRGVVFYSRSKFKGAEYETRLKSAYKALLVGLTEKYGEPSNMPEWLPKDSLQEGRILYMHMWRVAPSVFLMSGLGNMGAMEGYFPVFRLSGPAGHASQIQEGPGGAEEGMGRHSGIPGSERGGTSYCGCRPFHGNQKI